MASCHQFHRRVFYVGDLRKCVFWGHDCCNTASGHPANVVVYGHLDHSTCANLKIHLISNISYSFFFLESITEKMKGGGGVLVCLFVYFAVWVVFLFPKTASANCRQAQLMLELHTD